MTWQAGGAAGEPSCENTPTVSFAVPEEERARSRGIWILVPGVVGFQTKNQRKFSGEGLRWASWT